MSNWRPGILPRAHLRDFERGLAVCFGWEALGTAPSEGRVLRDTRAPSNRAMLLFALAVSGLQLPARHAPPRMMTDGPPARRTEAVESTEAEGGSLSDGPIFDLSFGKN